MDQSIIEAIREVNWTNTINCPTCQEPLVHPEGPQYDVCNTYYEGTSIVAIRHVGCRMNHTPKKLFICTQCGKNSNKKSNLTRSCRCPATNADQGNPESI